MVHASHDPQLAHRLQAQQLACYQNFAVQGVAKTVRDDDVVGSGIHHVVAEDHRGVAVGALRIHVRSNIHPLPVERAIPEVGMLHRSLQQRYVDGIAEYTGLWVVDEYRGRGLSTILVCIALACCPLLRAFNGVAFTHHHLSFWKPLGFEVDQTIGGVVYPDSRYRSSVLWIDTATLGDTAPAYRRMIHAIRAALSQHQPIYWHPDDDVPTPMQVYLGAQAATSQTRLVLGEAHLPH